MKAAQRPETLLCLRELGGVVVHLVAVTAQVGGGILHDDGGIGKGVGELGELGVHAPHTLQVEDGTVQRIERTTLARDGFLGVVGGSGQRFRVLGTGKGLLELLELTELGIHLAHALHDEPGLLNARSLGTRRRLDARELGGRGTGIMQRGSIRLECGRDGRGAPGIHHVNVALGIEQALVLVLAAEVDERPHAVGELAHAGDRAVDLHPAAAVRADAPRDRETL